MAMERRDAADAAIRSGGVRIDLRRNDRGASRASRQCRRAKAPLPFVDERRDDCRTDRRRVESRTVAARASPRNRRAAQASTACGAPLGSQPLRRPRATVGSQSGYPRSGVRSQNDVGGQGRQALHGRRTRTRSERRFQARRRPRHDPAQRSVESAAQLSRGDDAGVRALAVTTAHHARHAVLYADHRR